MTELADRIEALTGPCRETDLLIATLTRKPMPSDKFFGKRIAKRAPPYTGSIDAAMMLVPEGYAVNSIREATEIEQDENTSEEPLPLWSVALVRRDCTGYQNRKKFLLAFQHGFADTPALALAAAAIRARGE